MNTRRHASVDGEADAVRVRLLGGFSISVGNRIVREDAWHLRKAASLVKLLALSAEHRLHREQAMDLLWPELAPKAAANNLHYALHNARRTLGFATSSASIYLRFQGEQLALCPGGQLWVDVEAFEDAASAARRIRETGAYRRAVDLYAGELLPEDRYEQWAEARRQELRRVFLSLLGELGGLYEERGEYGAGIEVLGKANPTREGGGFPNDAGPHQPPDRLRACPLRAYGTPSRCEYPKEAGPALARAGCILPGRAVTAPDRPPLL